jgi:type I restriction enzyme S subunit
VNPNWRRVELGDICKFKYGQMPKKTDLSETGYPVFSGYRIVGSARSYHYEHPEIIVVARGVGGTGDVKLSPPKCFLTNLSIAAQIAASEIDKKFLYYRLLFPSLWELRTGSAQAQITIERLQRHEVTIPPLQTQRKIASILSAYDDLIENNSRRIAILEEMAQAIYREWFVNFRFPGHENVKLVQSTLGMIPEGWEMKCLSELGFIGRGKSRHRPRNAPELYGGPYPLFQTGDIKAASTFLWKHIQSYSEAGLAQSKLWEPGTLCITIAANIAETAILSKNACFPDSVVGFVSNPDHQCVYFVKLYLKTIKSQVQNVSRGTTQDNLSLEKLLSFKVPTPPSTLLCEFHACVTPVFDSVLCLAKKNDNLRTSRDLLLPKLISGQLDVEELDIDVGMIAETLEEATA